MFIDYYNIWFLCNNWWNCSSNRQDGRSIHDLIFKTRVVGSNKIC